MPMAKDCLRRLLALAVLAAGQACLSATAHASDGGNAILSPETLSVFADLRAVAVNGETSWAEGEFGKLRYGGGRPGGSDDLGVRPEFGEAGLVWQPRFSWSLSGTVVGLVQGGDRYEAGLSEAFLTYKPLSGGPVRFSARAGLMWPPVSLEHGGPEWAVTDTITPSAINSWMGEEVKVLGLELSGRAQLGNHALTATLAGFDANDTAGTLLAFRGWAMHDRKSLAFRNQPLPELNEFIEYVQPRYTHPVLDVDHGFLKRPGYYAKLGWEPPIPVRIELFHYDNNADPEKANADLEWGWRTRFDNIGLVIEPADGWQLRAQGLSGHTEMGIEVNERYWVETRFRSAFLMLTRQFERGSVSSRVDLFDARNRGTELTAEDDEDGWAATLAARREIGEMFTALAEFVHIESTRDARIRSGLSPKQTQDQLQLALRLHW